MIIKFSNKSIFYLFNIRNNIFNILFKLFYYNHNDYFEFNAQDSKVYFDNSLIILNNFKNDNNIYQGLIPFIKIEDLGFSTLIALIFYFLPSSIFTIIFFNIILKSVSSILIYKISKFYFSDFEARFSSILFTIIPLTNYYSSLILKEIFMIFLMLSAFYLLKKIIYKIRFSNLLFFFAILAILLTIRPIISYIFVLLFLLLFIYKNNFLINIPLLTIVIIFFSSILSLPIINETFELFENISTLFNDSINYSVNREGGNKLASFASIPLLLLISFFTPLPTTVKIINQEHFWLNMPGNFILLYLSVFFIITFYFLLRKQKNYDILILIFIYLLALSFSGLSTSVRRFFPILPFILILIPFGINLINKNFHSKYLFSGFFLMFLTFFWNVFKIIGKL